MEDTFIQKCTLLVCMSRTQAHRQRKCLCNLTHTNLVHLFELCICVMLMSANLPCVCTGLSMTENEYVYELPQKRRRNCKFKNPRKFPIHLVGICSMLYVFNNSVFFRTKTFFASCRLRCWISTGDAEMNLNASQIFIYLKWISCRLPHVIKGTKSGWRMKEERHRRGESQ